MFRGFVKASSSGGLSSGQSAKRSAPQPETVAEALLEKRKAESWQEFKTAQGQPYYYNSITKESTWLRPAALGLEQASTAASTAAHAEQKRYMREEKRRRLGEDAYFDDEEEEETPVNAADAEQNPFADEAIPAVVGAPASGSAPADDEVDPLDAFMAGIEATVASEKKAPAKSAVPKPRRDDLEDADDQDTFFEEVLAKQAEEPEEVVEYDDEGYPIRKGKESLMEVIPPIDYAKVKYNSVRKFFYSEHPEISALSAKDVFDLRSKLGLRASGLSPPKPIVSFGHVGFDEEIMSTIQKLGYTSPTPIQAQAVPAALCGRDVIGIAKTGSGKTAAYVWPMLVHIMDQPELEEHDGPIGVVLAPTRELCQQIYTEAKRFGKPYNLGVVAVFGGGNRYEQTKAIKEGCEVVAATPGRLIDLIKDKAVTLLRTSFLVLDEADRMFSMGFEPQIRSIINQIRPERQTLLFSATFRKRVESLARDILQDPVRIVVGAAGEANQDVTQTIHVIRPGQSKWSWLTERMANFTDAGSLLVFVTKKANCQMLAENLQKNGYPDLLLLHGDMDQNSRTKVISDFKKAKSKILVATDIAARGLDIPLVKTVVNFDIARDIDTHTHRVGRTGRAGAKGVAHTLLEESENFFAGELVQHLEQANQVVPPEVLTIANTNAQFRKKRGRVQNAFDAGRGGGGGGAATGIGGGKYRIRRRAGLGHQDGKGGPRQGGDRPQAGFGGFVKSSTSL